MFKQLGFIAFAMVLFAGCQTGRVNPHVDHGIFDQLGGKTWVAESIQGKPVVDMSRSSIEFLGDDKVQGRGGCNMFNGAYSYEEGVLTFGPLATTMRACVPALDDQEMRFFQALSQPSTIALENGLLLLTSKENGKVTRFAVHN